MDRQKQEAIANNTQNQSSDTIIPALQHADTSLEAELTPLPVFDSAIVVKQKEIHFDSEHALYMSYMPFIENGGIFIRTTEPYQLGDQLQLYVRLLDNPERHAVIGGVIWITPTGAQGGKAPGIGIQFMGTEGASLQLACEKILIGHMNATQLTDTM